MQSSKLRGRTLVCWSSLHKLLVKWQASERGEGGGHLLDVNAAGEQVGGDEHPGGAAAELPHDDIPRVLVHVSVGGRHGVVPLSHFVSQPVHL